LTWYFSLSPLSIGDSLMANIGHNALWGLLDWPQGDLIRLSEIQNQKQSISAAKSPKGCF